VEESMSSVKLSKKQYNSFVVTCDNILEWDWVVIKQSKKTKEIDVKVIKENKKN
jgi:hypothetical protein